MSPPEILKATLGDMTKENFSLVQAKQSTKCENKKKNKEQIKKEKNTVQDTHFWISNLTF